MTIALVTQSNYIPWKGYFSAIEQADVFVTYDIVQYTRRDWRNRNRIKTAAGLKWLTIPVQVKGKYHQTIDETMVADPDWAEQHWKTIRHEYAQAEHFGEFGDFFADLYSEAGPLQRLSDINHLFLKRICDLLGIETEFRNARDLDLPPDLTASERLIHVCQALGVDNYLTGPAARDYLDVHGLNDLGISVTWLDYSGFPEYPQLHGPFEHAVSIIDLILNTGQDARQFMKRLAPVA